MRIKILGKIAKIPLWQSVIYLVVGYLFLAGIFSILYYKFGLIGGKPGRLTSYYFSVVTQTTLGYGDFKPNNGFGSQFVVIIHTIIGMLYFALSSAIFIFKFLQPPKNIISFDGIAVYNPDTKSLRIRVYNKFSTPLTNVSINVYLRTWATKVYSTYNVLMKRSTIPRMYNKDPWNLVSYNQQVSGENNIERTITFSPKDINDKSELIVILSGEIDELKTKFIESATYTIKDIVCGELLLIDPKGVTYKRSSEMNWNNWGKYKPTDFKKCSQCDIHSQCILEFKPVESEAKGKINKTR